MTTTIYNGNAGNVVKWLGNADVAFCTVIALLLQEVKTMLGTKPYKIRALPSLLICLGGLLIRLVSNSGPEFCSWQVMIVSYETFRLHADKFQNQGSCDLLICDEAHRLKNDQTLTNKASLPLIALEKSPKSSQLAGWVLSCCSGYEAITS